MSDPFVAEIRMFAGNFAPKGWATCDGQLLPISQNTALFSLLGTFYGGDGKSTFALPNLEGSTPVGQGQGAGLSEYFLGQAGGTSTITLLTSEMPLHNHTLQADVFDTGDGRTPGPGFSLAKTLPGNAYKSATTPLVQMNFQALAINGSSLPHNNMMPFLVVTFIIAMQGVFPPRS
jgi:microcystin-dependent protein